MLLRRSIRSMSAGGSSHRLAAILVICLLIVLEACHARQAPTPSQAPPIADWQLRLLPKPSAVAEQTWVSWRTIAEAETIVRGTLTIAPADLAVLAGEPHDYVPLELTEAKALKGAAPDTITLLYYPATRYGVPAEKIASLNGTEVIASFVQPSPELDSSKPLPLHLLSSDDAMIGATPEGAQAVRDEATAQEALAARVAASLAASDPPSRAQVERLIDLVMTAVEAGGVVGWPIYLSPQPNGSLDFETGDGTSILTLDRSAVPALVAQMDDRRDLRIWSTSIWNTSPDAFEGLSHYQPETVVDFVSIVLQEMTRESFGFLNNGGSETERLQVIQAWRVWLGKSLAL